MQVNFQRKLSTLTGDDHLQFLLDTTSIISQYTKAQQVLDNYAPIAFATAPFTVDVINALKICRDANRTLCSNQNIGKPHIAKIQVPTACSACGGLLVDESTRTTFVCTECGLEERYFFGEGKHALRLSDPRCKMQFQCKTFRPLIYFKQRLLDAQGRLPRILDPTLVPQLISDHRARGISISSVSAETVRESLKRIVNLVCIGIAGD